MKHLHMYYEKPDDGNKDPEVVEKEPTTPEPEQKPEPEPTTPPTPEKTFTQAELNAINAKTKNKFLKELGFENEEAYKKHLADKEAAKPLEDKLKTLETANAETLSRAEKAEAKLSVLEKGVPKNKSDKVIKLAQTYDGDTIEAKIDAVLAEFPEFKAAGAPAFGNPLDNKGGKTKAQIDEAAFRAGVLGE